MFTNNKIKITLGACAAIIVFTVVLVYERLHHQRPQHQPVEVVGISPVKQQLWDPSIKSTGTLEAYQGIVIKSEIEGRVKQINFSSGQDVQAGDIILELVNGIQQADLDTAKVQLKLSLLSYQRRQELYPQQTVTKEELDQARTTYEADKAAVEKAQAELDQTIIKAPFSGRLGIIDIQPGDYLDKGDAIGNLSNIDSLYVDFNMPEVYLSQLKRGQRVSLKSSAYPKITFAGKVSVLETVVDSDTRSIKVRATLDNHQRRLLPGNFVEVDLYLNDGEQVLTIPQTAIVYSPTGDYVYKVAGQHAKRTIIKTGEQNGQSIIVLSGLDQNDQVVSTGTNKVHNGSEVKAEAVTTKTKANAKAMPAEE